MNHGGGGGGGRGGHRDKHVRVNGSAVSSTFAAYNRSTTRYHGPRVQLQCDHIVIVIVIVSANLWSNSYDVNYDYIYKQSLDSVNMQCMYVLGTYRNDINILVYSLYR